MSSLGVPMMTLEGQWITVPMDPAAMFGDLFFNSDVGRNRCVSYIRKLEKGNLPVTPFCHHTWRGVIARGVLSTKDPTGMCHQHV